MFSYICGRFFGDWKEMNSRMEKKHVQGTFASSPIADLYIYIYIQLYRHLTLMQTKK